MGFCTRSPAFKSTGFTASHAIVCRSGATPGAAYCTTGGSGTRPGPADRRLPALPLVAAQPVLHSRLTCPRGAIVPILWPGSKRCAVSEATSHHATTVGPPATPCPSPSLQQSAGASPPLLPRCASSGSDARPWWVVDSGVDSWPQSRPRFSHNSVSVQHGKPNCSVVPRAPPLRPPPPASPRTRNWTSPMRPTSSLPGAWELEMHRVTAGAPNWPAGAQLPPPSDAASNLLAQPTRRHSPACLPCGQAPPPDHGVPAGARHRPSRWPPRPRPF